LSMAGILSAFGRGAQKKDPMRESAALTTVYLLEQNRKFERFMQQRIDELESRVAAQQARLSTREEAEERELWAALEAGGDVDEVMAPVGPATENEPEPETPFDSGDEPAEWAVPAPEAPVPSTKPEGEAVPDYLALMGGAVEVEAKAEAEAEVKKDSTSASDEERFPADQNEPPDEVPVDEEELPSPVGDFTEQTDETAEIVPWMEAFSLAPPDSDEADDLWPELEGDEFELLAGADDEPLTPDSTPAVDRPTGLDEAAGPPPGEAMPAVTSLTTRETFGDEGTYPELHSEPDESPIEEVYPEPGGEPTEPLDEPPVEGVYPELRGGPAEPPVEGAAESVQDDEAGGDPGVEATGREPPDDTEMLEFEGDGTEDEGTSPATNGRVEETGADPEPTALNATDDPERLGEAATEDNAWDIPLSEGEKDDWT
jgi:hypothetical protein